ncbi:MAG: B12-binding domain-containing radical SAM protein [Gammaproteobacteria bacterium]|nr:B12-binding domain-containing radical SAM protein [Gammaproteobacteria bacterium]
MESPRAPAVLLIGPYDPHCGEFTFLAPPLGVWRLAGVLEAAGVRARVFDPNCCVDAPQRALERELRSGSWDIVGVSTTGMTLRYDLELAHLVRRVAPRALLVAGGMEATFRPQLMFELGPFDLVVLGEGERPLQEIVARRARGAELTDIPGTAQRCPDGTVRSRPQRALSREELRDAIFSIPYARMPYAAYWERLERAYALEALPSKAAREAQLAEIRSVRLITLNYCPMGCTFCSATNFLHAAQGSVAGIARLDAAECLTMLERIVQAHPEVRTVIFQDDIFSFTADARVLPLCEAIVAAKARGALPPQLQFISTNRIDAMTPERLRAMRQAGFRVLGFGIENFAPRVLAEFNKAAIHRHIEPVLTEALALGITPFLDLILSSPGASLADVALTLREAYRWLLAGCEIGMYPYVIPFSGARFAADPRLLPHTQYAERRVRGTEVRWQQAAKILPLDREVAELVLRLEQDFERTLQAVEGHARHLPSRLRSLLWILCAAPLLAERGHHIADPREVRAQVFARLPRLAPEAALAASA